MIYIRWDYSRTKAKWARTVAVYFDIEVELMGETVTGTTLPGIWAWITYGICQRE